MMASIIKESIINIDPDKINFDDKESVKELIIALLNTIEHLVQENAKLILDHPSIPLHNNESEIAAREPVIKRKISYGTRSELGKCAWENALSIKDTCRKLGVNFFQYI